MFWNKGCLKILNLVGFPCRQCQSVRANQVSFGSRNILFSKRILHKLIQTEKRPLKWFLNDTMYWISHTAKWLPQLSSACNLQMPLEFCYTVIPSLLPYPSFPPFITLLHRNHPHFPIHFPTLLTSFP